jgi:2-polyprenyl-3-methyl-5-hydroxy-6-metoxy-1,4-benzoquinol methylase
VTWNHSSDAAQEFVDSPLMTVDGFSEQDIAFHRETAASYDETVTNEFRIYHRSVLHPFLDDMAHRHPRAKVLDVGCGTGVVTLALAERHFDVQGIDHSPEMLELARAKARDKGLANVALEIGDAANLRFPDASFRGVTCQGMLHHLPAIRPALAELARVLEPGGFFFISEPCRGQTVLKRALVGAWHVFRPHRSEPESGPPTVEAPIDADELRQVLDELGLECELEFMTHLPRLHGRVPDAARLLLTRLVSLPWRRTKGDLVFATGRKQAYPGRRRGAARACNA